MLSHASLLQLLEKLPGVSHPDATPDKDNSVSSAVVRCVYQGERAVAVASDTKQQIGALLDVVDLHLHGGDRVGDLPVSPERVTCLVLEEDQDSEALDALRTLTHRLRAPFSVRVLRLSPDGSVQPVPSEVCDLSDAEEYRYARWPGLLGRIDAGPPELVRRIMTAAGRPEVRAYPMLSKAGVWSLRVEGLEVGRVGADGGTLAVGKDRGRRPSPKRAAWVEVAGAGPVKVDDATAEDAGRLIGRFARSFLPGRADGVGKPKQDEHALESRILRGAVRVQLDDGTPLQLLAPAADPLVNWGSQFPTRWGHTSSNSARYLDALLRTGRTPWALEIKVDGGGGTGQYYRHAVAQAVLYREFIRQATPLAEWFDGHELDQQDCRAAVVVPEFAQEGDVKAKRLAAVCAAFDVELIRVPREAAGLAGYRDSASVVADLAELLRTTGCSDIDELAQLVDADCEPDMWVAEFDGGIEIGSGTAATGLEFPFTAAEFWDVVDEVEQEAIARIEDGGDR